MKASEVNGKLGETRSVLRSTYLLHTPDAFVPTPLPGLHKGLAIVHASPRLGAKFLMYTAELEAGGTLDPTDEQRFLWVVSGELSIALHGKHFTLRPGSYAYAEVPVMAVSAATFVVIEKAYDGLDGVMQPEAFVGHEDTVAGAPLGGDEGLIVKALLPADTAFDFAVNTMTYAASTALAQVEVHVMEHGLLMLEGAGTYRLDGDFHDVEAGDCIWMAPFCPQWFGATSEAPAKYLIYKDWHRRPAL